MKIPSVFIHLGHNSVCLRAYPPTTDSPRWAAEVPHGPPGKLGQNPEAAFLGENWDEAYGLAIVMWRDSG